MDAIFLGVVLPILGLAVFEIISSADNAVINAQVLNSMKDPFVKKMFLTVGILFAVFVVRGLMPLVIAWINTPGLSFGGAFMAMLNNDPSVHKAIEAAASTLMAAGGMFLALLWTHWLFLENETFGLPFEKKFNEIGQVWFYAISSLLLIGTLIAFYNSSIDNKSALMLAAAIGSSAFFITQGFKENAEHAEEAMLEGNGGMSDWSKFVFLEVIDLCFSIDGVVGAFAFTKNVLFILVGNGIGAVVVRQLTVKGADKIENYRYLKNGAMYSVGVLGFIMLIEAFGVHVPEWVSPVVAISSISIALWASVRANKRDGMPLHAN